MENYTLIITEKPDAARRIAEALDIIGKPQSAKENGVPYYIAQREKKLVVMPALGHLYTVMQEGRKHWDYPVFNFKWAPRYVTEKGARYTRVWINTIARVAENAAEFIDACDYDVEGSLIGYTILKYACGGKEATARRMKYSTLTKTELEKAYETPMHKLDFALIESGQTRHEVDWLYGINLSRALTQAVKRASGMYAVISTGRVQGPTLNFLVAREQEINCHVPTPYWDIYAKVKLGDKVFEAEYEKNPIQRKAEADAVMEACSGKHGSIDNIDLKESPVPPPFPFDLSMLQYEVYGLFGYTPSRTSDIAQRLYLDALISYPRTSSQKLPPSIGYRQILNGLKRNFNYGGLASELLSMERLRPNEGEKEDPAHPAIYPTGNMPERELDSAERRIWDLIVRRFMAVFGEPALKQSMRVSLDISGHHFFLHGRRILRKGWMRFYEPYVRSEEVTLPQVKKGETVDTQKITCEDRFSRPPPRYNPSSLVRRMEAEGIGTKATRAEIVETLYNRKYIADKAITVTDLGFDVTETLNKYCPSVISVKLTRDLEEKMERIQNKEEKREKVLSQVIAHLEPLLKQFRENEKHIGQALSEAVRKARTEERILGDCPTCKTGKLIILYSRKTGKRFIGCTNYSKNQCKTTTPLPQKGTIKPSRQMCKACGWPTVTVWFHGRRPWRLCVNPACPKKTGRRKKVEMQGMR
ncbi:MAG: DNA topoisomerase I [Candidatus Bathyarchaeales archaeon]